MRCHSSRPVALALLCVCLLAATAWAQRFRLPEGPGVPRRIPGAHFSDGRFTHCKVMYTSVYGEPGGIGWGTDYPYAGINLMTRVSELTKTPISRDEQGEPSYWVVRLTDDALFRCPFIMAADVGTLEFQPGEVERLRAYLLKGGFLWVDDFWGTYAWAQWASEIHRVLPEYPIVDVPADHPIRHGLFTLDAIPQVSSINFWRRSRGGTRERGSDSPFANFRMIADKKNRIMVLMTHNTDIGDSWEREGENHEFFLEFSPRGYALGVNAVVYALTH
ncbi:MAG: DUF4159 domain-containing protein [Vicinamibacterales bacterium]